jgi:hypothetical protein
LKNPSNSNVKEILLQVTFSNDFLFDTNKGEPLLQKEPKYNRPARKKKKKRKERERKKTKRKKRKKTKF